MLGSAVPFVCAVWACAIPLLVIWSITEGFRAVAASGAAAVALVIAGLIAARAPRGLVVGASVAGLAALAVGYVTLRPVNRSWAFALLLAPFDPSIGDYLRVAGAAIDLGLVLAAGGLVLGGLRRELTPPLGVLLAVPALIAMVILLPAAAWIDILPSTALVAASAPVGRRLLRTII